jgi:chromosome segregation ATPase
MERKIESQELDVRAAESAVGQRRLETLATGGSTVIGMLTGKRRSLSGTLSKNRMASAAKDRLEAEKVTLKQYQDQLSALQKERAEAEKQIQEKWAKTEEEVKEVTIKPQRSDIYLEAFAIVWLPYYLVRVEDSLREIPAFER